MNTKNARGFSLIEFAHRRRDHRHYRCYRHPQPARVYRAGQRRLAIASTRTLTSAEATTKPPLAPALMAVSPP